MVQISSLCGNVNASVTPSIVSVYYNSKVIIKFRQWRNDLKLIWEDIVTISANKGLKQARIGKKLKKIQLNYVTKLI